MDRRTPLSHAELQAIAERGAGKLAEAREALAGHGAEPEELAEFVPARRRLLIARPARMVPLGRVWRLGSLLLATDGSAALYTAGQVTRSAERGRPNYQSASREHRREIAAAALRGGYPVGTAVNFAARRIPLDADGLSALTDDDPIGVFAGELRVRWRRDAPLDPAPSFESYLFERVRFLIDPPRGA